MGLVKAEVDIMGMFGEKFGEKWIKPLSSKLKKKKSRFVLQTCFQFKWKNVAALD